MSGLFTIMRNNLRSLSNFQAGLAVVANNVANANTEGFTRKRAIFTATEPEIRSFGLVGTGARLSRIEGMRDPFIERRLIGDLQNRGFFEGQQFGLGQIESTVFSSTGQGISDQMSRFFNSFSELTQDGSSIPLRQQVLNEAEKLAGDFNTAFQRLGTLALDNHEQMKDSVERINSLARRIADLNAEMAQFGARGQDGGPIQDERQQALNELAELMEFNMFPDENGVITVTSTSGAPLVLGGQAKEMTLDVSGSGARVFIEGREVTSEMTGGKLGGQLELDRNIIPGFIEEINLLAEEFATQVNAVHTTGEDLNGAAGQPLFSFTPGGAAGSIQVAISDPAEVAARTPGSGPGNTDIAQQMSDLRDQSFAALGDNTLTGFYSDIVFRAGLESRSVQESFAVQSTIVQQTTAARDSVSGVSLDEEAVNLIQFQRSYEASARVFQIVDRLLEETINLI